ncbi:zinc-finger-containing protein [Geoalkalibacter subterraneus]|uniref:Uncharacterized protein n=1 Tax=Geoalkalibacter subterraneus TaxID=483547 RepID=A0A0B5FX84_9BACT|nr:zinc-finger-containing protein [Geoalkalibacter subterraneus]AJF08211.1 hypothetical protein GSUB_17125 [Geoalkalibacter subterraneus]
MVKLDCPYCGKQSHLTSSREVYGGRDYGPIYLCRPCDAYVGCHPGTTDPLGRLADKDLRKWKKKAHDAFDPLWKEKARREECGNGRARRAGYRWLADQLGIAFDECHIGMFDIETCQRVTKICSESTSI